MKHLAAIWLSIAAIWLSPTAANADYDYPLDSFNVLQWYYGFEADTHILDQTCVETGCEITVWNAQEIGAPQPTEAQVNSQVLPYLKSIKKAQWRSWGVNMLGKVNSLLAKEDVWEYTIALIQGIAEVSGKTVVQVRDDFFAANDLWAQVYYVRQAVNAAEAEIDALATAQEVRDYPVSNAKAIELEPELDTWLNP